MKKIKTLFNNIIKSSDKFEQRIVDFIIKNNLIIFLIIVSILSFIMRYKLIDFTSGDVGVFSDWLQYFRNNGGISALKSCPTDYNIPYMFVLSILSHINAPNIFLIKLVSIFFDFTLAVSSALLVYSLLGKSEKRKIYSVFTYSAILVVPHIAINSSMWGQCDSIFATFSILSILFLINKKYFWSFVAFGVSFSFKLQAIFLLPLFLILYFKERNFSIFNFFIIPIVNFIMCLPAIIFGRSIMEILLIYFKQTDIFKEYIVLNLANIFQIFNYSPKLFYDFGTILTILILGMILFTVLNSKINFNKEKVILFSLFIIIITTFFLPGMHERYLYVGEIISIIYFIAYRKHLPLVLLININAMASYSIYLGGVVFNLKIFAIIGIIVLAYETIKIFNELNSNE